jgi:hypothetical protein
VAATQAHMIPHFSSLALFFSLCLLSDLSSCWAQQWPSLVHSDPESRELQAKSPPTSYLPYGLGTVAPATSTRVVVNEDEYIFIAFEGPSLVEYEVRVLEGPNVDVFLMDEVLTLPHFTVTSISQHLTHALL